ncbi:LytR/AlgR family response regulator transcription factor [Granulicella arctica]|uniref:LytR/AlgR family response regulator transcription factor n=1 Tax=Granulicella arctica TaxID=940613 RepID=UPI0021E0227D|nr:LytTR family DNA-binding domain-containing protein [Granulicella arctica]
MKVLIVDDEPLARRGLSQALTTFENIEVIGSASDGDQALSMIRSLNPDLVFLDIDMPGKTGIEVAATLGRDHAAEVVFVTAFDNYGEEAFSVEATDYLLKPLNLERLGQAISRAERRKAERIAIHPTHVPPNDQAQRSFILANGRSLPEDHIIWIEAAKDYALIHTSTRTHMIRATMSQLSERLGSSVVRVHRSALVAVRWVHGWKNFRRGASSLLLKDGTLVQVGPTYLLSTRKALNGLDGESR